MGKNKLRHFEENKNSHNLLESGKPLFGETAGKWGTEIFRNNNPLVLEIGCGKGEYTTGLAQMYPDKNFVGADIKGARLWKGSQDALALNLSNAVFLRTQIELINRHFAAGEVSEIWITFPDPKPRLSDSKRRLTSAQFLEKYRELLSENGLVQFKTDDRPLFDFTLEVLKKQQVKIESCTFDFYQSGMKDLVHGLTTTYEKRFLALGKPIHYVAFRFLPERQNVLPR